MNQIRHRLADSIIFAFFLKMTLSLSDHIIRSKQAASANKAKGNRHAQLLSGLYADPSRFLEEIIQNTEDACSLHDFSKEPPQLSFSLSDEGLKVYHNGKPFDENDLKAITTFAVTTKEKYRSINLIGKFGIGFRSVFSISDHPEIHSGGHHYRIVDHEVLDKIAPKETYSGFTTLIYLPFRKKEAKQSFDICKNTLINLGYKHLLFLRRLCIINIKIADWPEIATTKSTQPIGKLFKLVTIKSGNDTELQKRFLVAEKSSFKTSIAIAFAIAEDELGLNLIPAPGHPLFVWLPTGETGGLNFLLHGNFTTTPTRETVPFDKNTVPENIALANDAATFLSTILTKLKACGIRYYRLPEILPLKSEKFKGSGSNELIDALTANACKTIRNKAVLVGTDGSNWPSLKMAVPAEDAIRKLVDKKGLRELFKLESWICNDTQNWSEHDVLTNELGMRKVSREVFTFRLMTNTNWIENKKVQWLLSFYRWISDFPHLWDNHHRLEYYSLYAKPFILCDDGILRAAFDADGQARIHFIHTEKHSRIHRQIKNDALILRFLKEMGIGREPIKEDDVSISDMNHRFNSIADPELIPIRQKILSFDNLEKSTLKTLVGNPEFLPGTIPLFETESSNQGEDNMLLVWANKYLYRSLAGKGVSFQTLATADKNYFIIVDNTGNESFHFLLAKQTGTLHYTPVPGLIEATFELWKKGKSANTYWNLVNGVGSYSAEILTIQNPLNPISDGFMQIDLSGIRLI